MKQTGRSKTARTRSSTRSKPLSRTRRNAPSAQKRTKGAAGSQSKQDRIISLMRSASGASIEEMMHVSGWQAHSVRGMICGTIRKRLGLPVVSRNDNDGIRRYHIEAGQ